MASLNKVFLMGNLTRDPELRYTPSGTALAESGIAVNRRYTTPDGQTKDDTCYVEVNVWGRRAEVICEYLRKGSPIFIEGRLQYSTWENREGQKQSRLRVVAENFQFIGAPRRAATETPSEALPPSDDIPPDTGASATDEEEPPF